MSDLVRADLLKLFRANPLLRDTDLELATRLGRALPDVQKALAELEAEGVVSKRWVGNVATYCFTGAPDTAAANVTAIGEESGAAPEQAKSLPLLTAYLRIPSSLEGVQKARSGLEGLCRAAGMAPQSIMEFAITLSEALTNAHRYGRRGDGRDSIRILFKLLEARVEVTVKDRGSGFPFILVGSTQGDIKSTGGRGLMLMRSLADDLHIDRTPTGTVVRLVKYLEPRAKTEGTN